MAPLVSTRAVCRTQLTQPGNAIEHGQYRSRRRRAQNWPTQPSRAYAAIVICAGQRSALFTLPTAACRHCRRCCPCPHRRPALSLWVAITVGRYTKVSITWRSQASESTRSGCKPTCSSFDGRGALKVCRGSPLVQGDASIW
jgi:hypothetical protein